MSIEQQLQQHGFKAFNNYLERGTKGYVKSYQLRVRDDNRDTKYFINVDLYDYNVIPSAPSQLKEDYQPEFEVQYNGSGETFNVNYFSKDVDKAIAFYDKLFYAMDCEYYEKHDY